MVLVTAVAATQQDVRVQNERSASPVAGEIAREQVVVTALYGLLDALRDDTARQLDRVKGEPTAGTPGAMAERDAFATLYADRIARLDQVEDRLCFGRLDLVDGSAHHIGRIGLSDETRQRLLDWRAPVSAAFYQATAAAPGEVARRRHLAGTGRAVTALEDEVLQAGALPPDAVVVTGQGALAGALEAPRTGHMRDIVATVQAEQDAIVRAPLGGVLVVQGGPGTGKTAVALHRAAFLLYTHRDRIARSGVLLLGPSRAFLDYISAVLPSLGETGVVTATPETLMPGIGVTAVDDRPTAALKGDLRMVEVLADAVRGFQVLPAGPQRLDIDGTVITLWPRDVRASRERAWRGRRPHMVARRTFALDLLDRLATRLAGVQGAEPDEEDRAHLIATLRDSRDVVRAINRCWVPMHPQRLLRELFSSPQRLADAAPLLSEAERSLLIRPWDSGWTAADIALLDEAAELLGEDDGVARLAAARAAAERADEVEYAALVLRQSDTGESLDAGTLAGRYVGGAGSRAVADLAGSDRAWAYGHVVVDEAQELSPMVWRVLFRRCPSKSMTVVGDIAQTGSAAGGTSWSQVFVPQVGERWRLAELTVNYRTTGAVMELASRVLAATGAGLTPPTSARPGGTPPQFRRVGASEDVALAVAQVVATELADWHGGTFAVITPADRHADVAAAVATVAPLAGGGPTVEVLEIAGAKGLEFDVVVVVEPAAIVAASDRGLQDLYVALTRPTQRLHLVHALDLPAVLR